MANDNNPPPLFHTRIPVISHGMSVDVVPCGLRVDKKAILRRRSGRVAVSAVVYRDDVSI